MSWAIVRPITWLIAYMGLKKLPSLWNPKSITVLTRKSPPLVSNLSHSCPHPLILYIYDPFQYYLRVNAYVFQEDSSLQVSWPKFCMHPSSLQCVLYAVSDRIIIVDSNAILWRSRSQLRWKNVARLPNRVGSLWRSECIQVCLKEQCLQMKHTTGNAAGQHVTVGKCCFEADSDECWFYEPLDCCRTVVY
jgi:hypothetical protein